MTSPLKLPPLQVTILDRPTLDQLFADLAACARVHSVQPRTAPHAPPVALTLDQARSGLHGGHLRAVQVRYTYENKAWCDTLIAQADGVRLVRICEEDVADSVKEEGTSP
jgi:hypothetical protein